MVPNHQPTSCSPSDQIFASASRKTMEGINNLEIPPQKPQKHTGSQRPFLEFMGCLSPNARKNRFPSRHPAALVPNLAASQLLTLGQRLVPIFSNHGDGAVRFLTICHDLFSWTLNAPVFCIMVATTKYMQCIGSAAKMSFTRTCLYTFHVGNVGYRLV